MPTRQTVRTSKARVSVPRAAAAKAPVAARTDGAATIDADDRERLISLAAYYRAQGRGFAAGHEIEDWLAAEAEIDRELAGVPCGNA